VLPTWYDLNINHNFFKHWQRKEIQWRLKFSSNGRDQVSYQNN
jgi:hypothetical protein